MVQRRLLVGAFAVLIVQTTVAEGFQPSAPNPLYICSDATTADAGGVGATMCDATPTPELTRRADTDNLQVRQGALVVDLESSGVSRLAGLESGDLIYRVGGVDVTTAQAAVEMLSVVGTQSDTVVNFLRDGRPYRVKLRQD